MGIIFDSITYDLSVLFLSLLVFLHLSLKRSRRYFKERGIPSVKATAFLGDTFRSAIGLERLGMAFDRIYKKYENEKVVGLFQVVAPTLLIRDPQIVEEILIKNFSHFHDHGIMVDEKTNPLEGHLFNLSGEKWRLLRNKLSPTFTSGKLKWMFNQMYTCCEALMDTLEEHALKGDVEIKDVLACFTTDVIGSCAFGYEPSAIKDPNCEFRVIGKEIFKPSLKQMFQLGFRISFPKFFHWLKIKTIPKHISDFFYSVVRQTFQHRQKTGEVRNDFIQLLLQLKEKGTIEYDERDMFEKESEMVQQPLGQQEESLELNDDVLTAQAFVFFVGGFETSATTMSFALYNLANNLEVQDKARKEIRAKIAKHGGITYECLKDMDYLEGCINESMRITPPIEVLFRKSTQDHVFYDGTKIEKGLSIIIPVYSLHHDPEYYDEPSKFKPERFLGEARTPGTFVPFGDGPRICIGRRFALLEAKLGLAMILNNYRVTKSPKLKEPLEINPRSFILMPKDGLWMKFEKLTKVY